MVDIKDLDDRTFENDDCLLRSLSKSINELDGRTKEQFDIAN